MFKVVAAMAVCS